MAAKAGRCLLAVRLREIGMTQAELAMRLDISPSQISDYIARRRLMSIETAKSIADAVDCHMHDLYEWKQIKRSNRKRSK